MLGGIATPSRERLPEETYPGDSPMQANEGSLLSALKEHGENLATNRELVNQLYARLRGVMAAPTPKADNTVDPNRKEPGEPTIRQIVRGMTEETHKVNNTLREILQRLEV